MKQLLSTKFKNVYDCLQDEESKAIFMARIGFFFTGEMRYWHDMIVSAIQFASKRNRKYECKFTMIDEFVNVPDYNENKIVLYGAGFSLDLVYPVFERFGLKVSAICDSSADKQGENKYGFTVISPEVLFNDFCDAIVIITAFFNAGQIYQYLINNGFLHKNIICMVDFANMYFGTDFIIPVENEIYLDVGLYNINTIKQFISFCGGEYKKILGFEPDKNCYKDCISTIKKLGYKNVEIINKGAYSHSTTLYFNDSGKGISKIDDSGRVVIETISIDEMCNDRVTFIKMDIEGTELEALKGATDTIKRNKPRLAISIYHKPEDIIDILMYIHDLVPEYRFWIRQYSYFGGETVLYCVI